MPQTSHGTGQRDHCGKTFCELVEARDDAAILLQPAKHTLDDVPLPLFWAIKQPGQPRLWLSLHGAQRYDRLHPIAIAVAAQSFSIVAFIGEQPPATFTRTAPRNGYANVIKEWLGVRNVARLAARKQEAQRNAVGVAEHVNLGC
jgi:hypothetical protein